VASICSTECSWLLRCPRACFQWQISFLIRKCAHSVVSAHISLQAKHLTSFWKKKAKPASINYFAIVVLATNKTCGTFPWKFLSFLCCRTSCFESDFSSQCQRESVSYLKQYSRILSCLLADERAQRPISLPPVIASVTSSIVFFDDTSWRSSATALLVKLGLFSSSRRPKSVTTCCSILCSVLVQVPQKCLRCLHCHCKIVTWMFLDLAATSSLALPILLFPSFRTTWISSILVELTIVFC